MNEDTALVFSVVVSHFGISRNMITDAEYCFKGKKLYLKLFCFLFLKK